jgi:hypothetical protein
MSDKMVGIIFSSLTFLKPGFPIPNLPPTTTFISYLFFLVRVGKLKED